MSPWSYFWNMLLVIFAEILRLRFPAHPIACLTLTVLFCDTEYTKLTELAHKALIRNVEH